MLNNNPCQDMGSQGDQKKGIAPPVAKAYHDSNSIRNETHKDHQ
jgi:hypothetical protein